MLLQDAIIQTDFYQPIVLKFKILFEDWGSYSMEGTILPYSVLLMRYGEGGHSSEIVFTNFARNLHRLSIARCITHVYFCYSIP